MVNVENISLIVGARKNHLARRFGKKYIGYILICQSKNVILSSYWKIKLRTAWLILGKENYSVNFHLDISDIQKKMYFAASSEGLFQPGEAGS